MQLIRSVLVGVVLAWSVSASADPVRYAMDTLIYVDSDHVVVVSPQAAVRAKLDEAGGEVSARAVLDIISAASVDVVSQATKRFSEIRKEADLGVSKRIGPWLPGAHYRYSLEPDYESQGFGASLERRLGSPDTVGSASGDLTLDTIGRHGTSQASWSRSLTTFAGEVAVTQTLGPRTLMRGVYTLTAQSGYLEKPYRYVPLFTQGAVDAASAAGVQIGLRNFDAYRLATRPTEEVPDQRLRHALGVRLLRFVDWLDGSVRVDYRLYFDSWGMTAHTVEAELARALGSAVMLHLTGRAHLQTGASFYRREYVVGGEGEVPRWRTLDRDLGPELAFSAGSRLEWTRGTFSSYLEATGNMTNWSDSLLLDRRYAVVGEVGLRWLP